MRDATLHFKTCSRDRYQEIFASKTNPPAVGHYRPNMGNIDPSKKCAMVRNTHENTKKALKLKF